MRAKIYNLSLAILLFIAPGISLAKSIDTKYVASAILDPTDVKLVKSECGNYLLLDAKNKHLHLSSKDIDMLGIDPVAPDNSACYLSSSASKQNMPLQDDNDADKQVKTYSKSYAIDAGTRLDIDNRYGKVTVNTWSKNEFKVDVQIQVTANKADDTRKFIDRISINDSRQGQTVFFKTNIDKESQPGLFGSKNSSRKIEINYVIYMPAQNALNITNKYGNVELPELNGKLVINCAYGNLQAKSLSNPANQIKVSYGDARIGSLKATDLDISYGSLVLGSVDKLNADVKYSSAKIGTISTSGIINVKYGSGIQISNLDENMRNLMVDAKYSNIKLGLSNEDADFDVTVHYGSFNYGNHLVNILKTENEEKKGFNPTKTFKGHVGKGNIARVININSSYSSVKFE
ncbi:hypothetical protein GCM10027049_23880 [Mucilaginibacter puniceus]